MGAKHLRIPFWIAIILYAGIASVFGSDPMQEFSVWQGVYSASQAQRGAVLFERHCVACHAGVPGGAAGEGTAPAVIGDDFRFRWTESSVADLYDTIRQTMPEAAPNSLGEQEYLDVTAFLLQLNEYPTGENDMMAEQRTRLLNTYIEDAPAGDD